MTQIRQLELELYGDDVMLDWLFKKQNKETPETISRREFLRRGGQVGAALVGLQVANSGIGKATEFLNQKGYGNSATEFMQENLGTKKAQAGNNFTSLPPGIVNCRDIMIPVIWADKINLMGTNTNDYAKPNIAYLRFGNEIIEPKTPILEPALYLLMEKTGKPSNFNISDEALKNKNPALYYFKDGINSYFNYWIRRNGKCLPEACEISFINSIFCAAYESENIGISKSKEFRNLQSLQERTLILQQLMNRFSKMKKNEKSKDPNDGYNRCLVAAWSSTWLANNYWEMQRIDINKYDPLRELFNTNLEIPLRKYIPKIRGPPFYINSYI